MNSVISITHFSAHRGFTLLEVMISIAILAIGMLGLAGLNMVAIEHNHAAYLRSQAIIITQDIVERMKSNPQAVNHRLFDNIDTDNISTLTDTSCLTDALGCNYQQLAQIDIMQWAQSITQINNDNTRHQLPKASATVQVNGATAHLFTVKIQWRVKRLTKDINNVYARTNSQSNYEFKIIMY